MDVLKEAEAPSWASLVRDFDKAYQAFETNRKGLLAQAGYIVTEHPELLAEYNALVARANEAQAKIASLKSVRDTVAGWLSAAGGVFGLSGLGVLPLIPIAIGLGGAITALTFITRWLTDASKFASKVNEMKRLEAQGMSPEQAAKVIAKLDPQSDFSKVLMWGALLIGAALLLPMLGKGVALGKPGKF